MKAVIRLRAHPIDSAYLRRLVSAAGRAVLVPVLMLGLPNGESRAAGVIVVNSNADTSADDGTCTLREALTAANTDTPSGRSAGECSAGSGDDIVRFNISGPPDFTNGGRKGYSIRPNTVLPRITWRVVIDGFSQSGAKRNTAPNPRPLNTRILIEIDGVNARLRAGAGQSAFDFQPGSDGSRIHGLAINNMGFGEVRTNIGDPSAIGAGAAGLVIRGNYIGSDPTGLVDKGNLGCGVCMSHAQARGLILGGPHPADRNIIVGNDQTGASPNAGADGWVIQGNYIGLGADGLTAIGNSVPDGSGGMSIDNVADTLIGGDSLSEINVISANLSMGLAPFGATRLTVQGNRIGTDWTGTQP
ncbi:MAG: CSLREA domain-containing protein, partial [Gammaproteobacteria bacterium]|nr:CSLREA domain-containing protein [Gammaproteobacteria bacterium]